MAHKLLLADDSVTIQRVIELTFADEDIQVIAVGNGQQAIESAERDKPDIVLADIGMPERDGYEVAAFIKGHPALAHVPVILLTGAFEPIDETRARAVGCDGVLVKPFEPQMVISRVKDLLAGRKPAGLWGTGPTPQGPVRQAADADVRTSASGAQADGSDPLEAYFDRLDAAFTSPAGPGQAAAVAPGPVPAQPRQPIPLSRPAPAPAPQAAPAPARQTQDDLGSWDRNVAVDPGRPAPLEPTPAADLRDWAPAPAIPPTVAASHAAVAPARIAQPLAAPPATTPPSLVDAFAALLAAEQQTAIHPPAAPEASSIDDRLVDAVAERVLARLADQTRPTVLDVAERIVREEIDRIKGSS